MATSSIGVTAFSSFPDTFSVGYMVSSSPTSMVSVISRKLISRSRRVQQRATQQRSEIRDDNVKAERNSLEP